MGAGLTAFALAVVIGVATYAYAVGAFHEINGEQDALSASSTRLDLREQGIALKEADLAEREARVVWFEDATDFFERFNAYLQKADDVGLFRNEGEQFVDEYNQLLDEGRAFRTANDPELQKALTMIDELNQQVRDLERQVQEGDSGGSSPPPPDSDSGNAECAATGTYNTQVTLPQSGWTNWVGAGAGTTATYSFCAPAGTTVAAENGNQYSTAESVQINGRVSLQGPAGQTVTVYWTP